MSYSKFAVACTAFNRPLYLKEVLASWKSVRGINDVPFTVYLEPSSKLDLMLDVVKLSGMQNISVKVNHTQLGVLSNPWNAIDSTFRDSQDADFVILAEDDLVVSSDVLEYFSGAYHLYRDREVLGVCAHNSGPGTDSGATALVEHFEVWVWGTWRFCWYSALRDTWDKDYSTYNEYPGNQSGWDWNLSRLAKTVRPFVHPDVSRSRHIGKYSGTHMTPELFDRIQCPSFELDRSPSSLYRV